MKIIIKYGLFFICLLSFTYGNAQEIPIQEQWGVIDYIIKFDITCKNCNEEQKARIVKSFRDKLDRRVRYNLIYTYLIFEEDNTFEGSIKENEISGTYEQQANHVILYVDDEQFDLELKNYPDYRQILLSYGDELLDIFKGSFELDDIGQVDFQLTELTLIFQNLFDEPYDEYLEKKWEEEMSED